MRSGGAQRRASPRTKPAGPGGRHRSAAARPPAKTTTTQWRRGGRWHKQGARPARPARRLKAAQRRRQRGLPRAALPVRHAKTSAPSRAWGRRPAVAGCGRSHSQRNKRVGRGRRATRRRRGAGRNGPRPLKGRRRLVVQGGGVVVLLHAVLELQVVLEALEVFVLLEALEIFVLVQALEVPVHAALCLKPAKCTKFL